MLYSRKNTEKYNTLVQKMIKYVEKTGYEEIKADFRGYESPACLNMVNQQIKFTPDLSAKRGNNKFYFELAVKNGSEEEQNKLISKWKALESIAKIKGGSLQLFVPHGSYKYAIELIQHHNIEAKLKKINEL